MKGQDHIIQWELKYFNKEQLQSGLGKKESVESIVWFCPQVVALDGALVMFPRPTNLPPQTGTSNSGLYGGLALAMANGMLQSAGVDISRSYFQAAGSTDLQSTYMILAPDPASALQLCSAVQDLVQNWPLKRRGLEMPSIVIDSSGTRLRVVCNNISCNNKYVLAEKMVGLGQAIVSAFA